MTRPATVLTAALALIACTSAQAAPKFDCLSRQEVAGLATVMLPSVMDGIAGKCASVLPASAYLLTGVKTRTEDLRAMRTEAMPDARRAFLKFGSQGKADKEGLALLEAMPDDMLISMLETGLVDEMVGDVKPASCADIDRIARPLAPLPTANLIELVSELFLVGTRDKNSKNCPA